MTAAAAAVTCLVALVRFLEARSPDAEPVLYEPRFEEKASIAETLLPTRSERVVARSSSTPKPAKTESTSTKPAPAPILLAPGTLELLVLDGETPLAGARLTAVGRIEGGIEQGFIEENAHPLLATTSASGLVTWRELAPPTSTTSWCGIPTVRRRLAPSTCPKTSASSARSCGSARPPCTGE